MCDRDVLRGMFAKERTQDVCKNTLILRITVYKWSKETSLKHLKQAGCQVKCYGFPWLFTITII